MEYDVVIVGSGPAGSVTARFAAEAGANVLILERRAEVGVPVLCGEGISQRVDKWDMLEGKRWIASKMDGASPAYCRWARKAPGLVTILERHLQ